MLSRKSFVMEPKKECVIFLKPKTCSVCGTAHQAIENDEPGYSGICSSENLWMNCACGSTLMVKKESFVLSPLAALELKMRFMARQTQPTPSIQPA